MWLLLIFCLVKSVYKNTLKTKYKQQWNWIIIYNFIFYLLYVIYQTPLTPFQILALILRRCNKSTGQRRVEDCFSATPLSHSPTLRESAAPSRYSSDIQKRIALEERGHGASPETGGTKNRCLISNKGRRGVRKKTPGAQDWTRLWGHVPRPFTSGAVNRV